MSVPVLEARGISLSIERKKGQPQLFFRDLNFSLAEGELLVLAGKNGSGKSLLCRLLSGLIEPQDGAVFFRGKEISDFRDSPALRTGYVFEDARLETLGETAGEDLRFGPANAGLGAEETERRVESALSAVGLKGREQEAVHELSGGELRRLAIADVLCLDPPVLILDEPFANLDLDGVRSVLRIILGLKEQGRSLIVATHEIEKILGAADSFALMNDGQLVLQGTPEDVLRAGVSRYGLRDPFAIAGSVRDLLWL